MSDPLLATAPDRHACVHASAGTGKTWLLVTRLIRLLLAGAQPASILAVTFTRKAAAEMLERLNLRLAELAGADRAGLDAALQHMGLSPDDGLRERARRLYETLLFSPRPPRATTFHAFCQDLLQRFPVEAGIPPGFELLDSEAELQEAAWEALYAEATLAPDSPVAQALESLFDGCGGLSSTRTALNSFLGQRIDWWAFTRDAQDPVAYATAAARRLFKVADGADPLDGFFNDLRLQALKNYAALLGRHDAKTFQQKAQSVLAALQIDAPIQRHELLRKVFLTTAGEAKTLTISKALRATLGEADSERLRTLHADLCSAMLELLDAHKRLASARLNQAWYRAGVRLLEHYQRLKREQRVLDFADLEWHAYRLLNHSGQAHWVQYKLDARLDHILIDEFQDTNPTQWRLLLPVLQELAAAAPERERSVFLVGDAKQSIYGFRRADARLLNSASDWLVTQLGAEVYSLDASRRSAEAIMTGVNRVFVDGPLAALIPDFPHHRTYRDDLWGQVELLPPLSDPVAPPPASAGMRDPLLRPRPEAADDLHSLEARRLAQRIRELVDSGTLLGPPQAARPLQYGDILILLRSRTHAGCYEQALRAAGIPYLGAARGALLDSLEVQDLEALLNCLIAPHNDLALAQVLRSPLFAVSDDDLISLSQAAGDHWMMRLVDLEQPSAALARAARLLSRWQTLIGALPVHDLLDCIYHEGDVLKRFEAAATAALRPRVRANLIRFIELALEVDSGRYPSLPHFVTRLGELRQRAVDAPDDAPPDSGAGERVRFLTVHGAKGLEAPVVILADCAAGERDRNAWSAQVDWPAERERPQHIILAGRKAERDSVTRKLLEHQLQKERREDANLLYVAMTRAQQILIVSAAVTADNAQQGWYGILRDSWAPLMQDDSLVLRSGTAPQRAAVAAAAPAVEVALDPRLQQPLQATPLQRRIAPSRLRSVTDISLDAQVPPLADDPDARQRGIAIHRLLEWLCSTPARDTDSLLRGIAREMQRSADDPELQEWLAEARAVLSDPTLARLFEPRAGQQSYNEVALQYELGGVLVDGVIDRLLVDAGSVHIIDYKTHRVDADGCAALAPAYREQLRLYREGVARLWPERDLRCSLLFTHTRVLLDL